MRQNHPIVPRGELTSPMESEPPQWWTAVYAEHVKQKRKACQDGVLLLYPASGRLVLLNDAGETLESTFLRSSEEVSAGATLSFQAHLVDVGEPMDGPDMYASASGSGNVRRGGGARVPLSSGRVFPPRVPDTFVNPSKSHGCGGGGEGEAAGCCVAEVANSEFQEWTALYTAQVTQKSKKYHDGLVRLVQIGPQAKRVILLDGDGQVLCSRHLQSGESIERGKKCYFLNYLVDIREAKSQSKDHMSEESMVHTKPNSVGNTSNIVGLGASSRSHKFISPQKIHDLEDTKSEVTASSGKPDTDKAEAVYVDQPGNRMESDSDFKEWNVLYTTQLTQKSKKFHDGIIRLEQIGSHTRKIVLLDEYDEVLGSRYLKSTENVESGKTFQMLNKYLIDVYEFRNKNETRYSSKDASSLIGLCNEENTSDKMSEISKSLKFVSPFKFQDIQKSHWERTTSSNRPQIGKTTTSNLNAPPNLNVLSDLQRSDCDVNRRADGSKLGFEDIQRGTATNLWPAFGKYHDLHDRKSGCPSTFDRRDLGKSTFANMDHSLRTASQILSLMKPPGEVKILESAPSGQAHSLASSGSRTAFDVNCRKSSVVDDSNRAFGARQTFGLSHFATHLRIAIQSCLKLETLPRVNRIRDYQGNESSMDHHSTYDDPNIRNRCNRKFNFTSTQQHL